MLSVPKDERSPMSSGGGRVKASDAYYADKWFFRPRTCCDDIILRREGGLLGKGNTADTFIGQSFSPPSLQGGRGVQ